MVDLNCLKEKWPSAIVARSEISRFSGGIISPATMANLDSQGKGPIQRINIGARVAYKVDELVSWMENRAKNNNSSGGLV